MRGSRDFCQSYLVLSLFYSLQRGSNGFIAEKFILILYQGSRGGPLFSRASADPEGGTGGSAPPPVISQVIWVSIGNKQLNLEKWDDNLSIEP